MLDIIYFGDGTGKIKSFKLIASTKSLLLEQMQVLHNEFGLEPEIDLKINALSAILNEDQRFSLACDIDSKIAREKSADFIKGLANKIADPDNSFWLSEMDVLELDEDKSELAGCFYEAAEEIRSGVFSS